MKRVYRKIINKSLMLALCLNLGGINLVQVFGEETNTTSEMMTDSSELELTSSSTLDSSLLTPSELSEQNSTEVLEEEQKLETTTSSSTENTQTSLSEKESMSEPRSLAIGKTNRASTSVETWQEFMRALANPNVMTINIIADLSIPSKPRDGIMDITARDNHNNTGVSSYLHLNPKNIARKVVIEGNDHVFDFGSISLLFYDINMADLPNGWDITWKDLTIYHGNIYGFTTYNDLSAANERKSLLTYHNIVNYGSQMVHSPDTDIVISGVTKTIQVETYSTKFRPVWKTDGVTQINIYATNLTIMEAADFELESLRAGNIHLMSGSLTMKKNAKMTITAGQNDYTGEGDGGQTNLRVQSGNVNLAEGAKLLLNPKPNYSALNILGTNNQFEIGKNAEVLVTVAGHTNGVDGATRSILFFESGIKVNIRHGGILEVDSQNMAGSHSHLVYMPGKGNILLEQGGSLKLSSDSNSQSQVLLYIANQDSSIIFQEAKLVDLHRKATITGTATTNGLIYIAGTQGSLKGDTQRVRLWERHNLNEAKPNYDWDSMYQMGLTYSSKKSTVNLASSLTQVNMISFKNNFTTQNVQRVLFTALADVDVTIESQGTDDVATINATTVSGQTNPGAYVRLSSTPISSSVTPEIDPATNGIKSPVTGIGSGEPELQGNFTLIADETGRYSYSLPAGTYFKAGSQLKVFSFLAGKSAVKEQVVLDKTPPQGQGNDYHLGIGAEAPDPSVFVKNPTDTHPLTQTFSYAYTETTLNNLPTYLVTDGQHEVQVYLRDEAGNQSTITATLHVHQNSSDLVAKDLEIELKELKKMTEEELLTYLLTESQATAYKIADGLKTDLTSAIQVSDFAGLTSQAPAGNYQLTLTVKGSEVGLAKDLTTELMVKVVTSEGSLKIQFVNEVGASLHDELVIVAEIGEKIDLTAEGQVTEALAKLSKEHYKITERPADEKEVEIKAGTQTLTYKLTGVLKIKSAPTKIEFGSQPLSIFGTKVEEAEIDQPLIIWDNRSHLASWTLTATLETPLHHLEDDTRILADAIRYQNDFGHAEDIILSDEALPIETHTHEAPGELELSKSWGADKNGFKLNVPAGNLKKLGDYQGVILWQLSNTR